jgi:uncharacterized membrane protein YfcA
MTLTLLLICLTAFFAAVLTFFSGFGLGTLLAPVLMIFFPVDEAIAMTGVVHFLNNIFKLVLVGKYADKFVLIRFGIPAMIAAFAGAQLLVHLDDLSPLFSYTLNGTLLSVFPVKFVIALLLLFFAAMELIPALQQLQFGKKHLIAGGLLSGFFGGLSGNQGALRSAFLIKAGLSKEAFLGTAVVVSSAVDLTRLGVYANRFEESDLATHSTLLIAATLSAFAGAFIGNKLFKKVTVQFVQYFVALMLVVLSLALGMGLI